MTVTRPSGLAIEHSDQPASTSQPRIVIERHGIDHIPLQERHGRPRDLGLMWSSVGLNVQCVIYGALLIAIGLSRCRASSSY